MRGNAERETPWTREQIEAYRRGDDLIRPDIEEPAILIERDEIVKCLPEAPRYDPQLTRRLGPVTWNRFGTEKEIRAGIRDAVAALWARALSDERREEAPRA